MINIITQQHRLLQLITPLGENYLILTGLQGEECLSTNFCYHLNMFSTNIDIQAPTLIGKMVTIIINQEPDKPRYINGIVNQFQAGNLKPRNIREYQAQIVPWLWFLTQTTDCRIFQNTTTLEIIKTIFNEYSFHDYDMSKVIAIHNKREYCVQYAETSFDFISRLMEEEGIFYYYKHQKNKHILVLSDKSSSCQTCVTNVNFNSAINSPPQLTEWQHTYNYYTGKISSSDYNFLTPNNKLFVNQTISSPLTNNIKYSNFYYPGNYNDTDSGNAQVKLRLAEQQTKYSIIEGTSTYANFMTGSKITVIEHECTTETGDYLLTSVKHEAQDFTHLAKQNFSNSSQTYHNKFTAIPLTTNYCPARVTKKPIIYGYQTATVVGAADSEIYTDQYGRIKVQFHWDRAGNNNETSSCWIRVAQLCSGNEWGTLFIPRVGQEAVISFSNGNPDKPLVIGSVYNPNNMPCYELPANQSKIAIKTRSIKNNEAQAGNQLYFEDKKDQEEFYIFAQKNFNCIVKNNHCLTVGDNHQITSSGTCYIESKKEITLKVGTNTIKIDSSQITISGKINYVN